MQTIIWQPQPGPQTELIRCPVFEVFYGGARGGGKTEGSIGDWLEHSNTYGQWATGVFFRRKFKQLEQVIARTRQLFPQVGAKCNEQKAEWTMPGGASLKFRYLERDSDAQEYQGHSYTRVYVEELTNFPSPAPVNLLRGTLRSAQGVPVGMRCTGNPGGPGHHWVKARYITPAPKGWKILTEEFVGVQGEKLVLERVFIPSKISDNALLYVNDPYYIARLRQAGSEALRQGVARRKLGPGRWRVLRLLGGKQARSAGGDLGAATFPLLRSVSAPTTTAMRSHSASAGMQ